MIEDALAFSLILLLPVMPSLLNLASLSPEALRNETTQLEALQKIGWALNRNNADQIILLLASKPGLLDLACFPSAAKAFASSLGGTLLRQLSNYLFSVRRVLPPGTQEKLDASRLKVDKIPIILTSLSDANHLSGSQVTSRKKAKIRAAIENPEVFRTLGISLPSSAQQAEGLVATLLQEQKETLKEYFDVLQDASLAHIFKTEYFSQVQITSSGGKPAEVGLTVEEPQSTGTSVLHSAYPAVQPKKAAVLSERAAGFGDWCLLLSARATKDLRELRWNDQALLKIILKRMRELSNGNFSRDNQKRLNQSSSEVPIYEAKTRDLRLIVTILFLRSSAIADKFTQYQVDCVPEYDSSLERQGTSLLTSMADPAQSGLPSVLRIFGVYNHTQNDRLWQSMGIQLATKGIEYRRRCIYRKPHFPGDDIFVPGTFPPMEVPETKASKSELDLPHDDLDALHSLLVLEKFVVFSQALLNSIVADKDVKHIFDVSPQERAIIQHPSSCYVIGRSGTGKTTTMLFKMFLVENGSTMLGDKNSPKPRQLFVTQSRMLAGKVEEYFAKLMEALATARYSLEELAILAKSHREEAGLVDLDDQANWRNDLPGRFSELQDEHFPLFITFDRLCGLLEADFMTIHRTTGDDILNRALGEQNEGAMITYDIFRDTYWNHFPQLLTKGLDPSLVFSEIMGVIKGSEAALNSPDRFVRKNDYVNLSHRTQSTFALKRGTIYDIFKVYMKHKHDAGHRDSADRTHDILNALAAGRLVPRNKVDYILKAYSYISYVDEVQDNLLIDAQLLWYLCRNRNGLFWAGDIAQTISVGSSFRFDDLKAFLFRVEERNSPTAGVSATVIHPQTFQLAVNYRSHAGIVNTAHTLISLIAFFWPRAIDTLVPETGLIGGLKPVFFHGWNADTVRYEQFLFGTSGEHLEFGAQQCILVRDDRARNQLRDEVGDVGLIMTLYESKGLEFNDVLLYNFFENSAANLSQWRVVLNTLPPTSLEVGVPAPRFDDTRHAVICSELKSLYVAITRARKNVWIVDCSKKGEPMRMVWESKNQVHSCTPGADVPQLAVSSTPEEWAATGKKLFQHKRYIQAIHCFKRASMFREVDVAQAYSLRAQARAIPTNQDVQRKTAFTHVAEAFLQCAAATKKPNERRIYYTIAGDCFIILVAYHRAAETYLAGEEFTKAAISYRKAGNVQEAVEVIKQHRRDMDADVADSGMDFARLSCFRDPDIEVFSLLWGAERVERCDSVAYLRYEPRRGCSPNGCLEVSAVENEIYDINTQDLGT
ncbi:P-loop containing nucleoside triphosphate hydrolase protein [Athelia psychrophila]|uniref:P-loop containing nucleoside triphosphate hydrolase protein n=1 Tax=Athelia psychrophila TaxID=1759441 RepID=A0A166DXW3_9AGAM|nr:P-loop containing nucleoside triphosphate hydrolase protein [Fibularhizoctonia sp. CBS 109695]